MDHAGNFTLKHFLCNGNDDDLIFIIDKSLHFLFSTILYHSKLKIFGLVWQNETSEDVTVSFRPNKSIDQKHTLKKTIILIDNETVTETWSCFTVNFLFSLLKLLYHILIISKLEKIFPYFTTKTHDIK